MTFADFMAKLLKELQEDMDEQYGVRVPLLEEREMRDIVTRERETERKAAAAGDIDRFEILIDDPEFKGTLRFLPYEGHFHGMLWVERFPGRWVAYPFSGDLKPGDPVALMARLDELGTPYTMEQTPEQQEAEYRYGDQNWPLTESQDE